MLGNRIKLYMEKNGIKQTFLSNKTGISPQTISAILNGNRKIEAVEYFKICKALNIPLESMFSEDTESLKTG